jgi:hypothetical protein
MKDDLERLLDEAIAARRSAAVLSRRQQREELALQEFKEEFGEELDNAYAAATPSESTCNLYFKLFREFAEWLRTDDRSSLPATGVAVFNYLFHLALNGAPLPRIKNVAAAIAWSHEVGGHYLDAAYIQVGLAAIAKLLSPDDGGGESLPSRTNITLGNGDVVPAAGGT